WDDRNCGKRAFLYRQSSCNERISESTGSSLHNEAPFECGTRELRKQSRHKVGNLELCAEWVETHVAGSRHSRAVFVEELEIDIESPVICHIGDRDAGRCSCRDIYRKNETIPRFDSRQACHGDQ